MFSIIKKVAEKFLGVRDHASDRRGLDQDLAPDPGQGKAFLSDPTAAKATELLELATEYAGAQIGHEVNLATIVECLELGGQFANALGDLPIGVRTAFTDAAAGISERGPVKFDYGPFATARIAERVSTLRPCR